MSTKKKVFCPECQKQGVASKVFPRGQSSTLLYAQPYYDEQGNYTVHDPNTHTTHFTCSRDHAWTEVSTPETRAQQAKAAAKSFWVEEGPPCPECGGKGWTMSAMPGSNQQVRQVCSRWLLPGHGPALPQPPKEK